MYVLMSVVLLRVVDVNCYLRHLVSQSLGMYVLVSVVLLRVFAFVIW